MSPRTLGFSTLKFLIPLVSAVALSACQDHHFVPIEKADEIKLPSNQPGPEQAGKMMEAALARQANKREQAQAPAGPAQLLVEGEADLGAGQKKRDFTGYTLYVIAWPKESNAPPIAAARYNSPKFPIKFRMDTRDLMTNYPPAPGTVVNIEARLDKNSDPTIKSPGDVMGVSAAPVVVGANDVKITIDRDR